MFPHQVVLRTVTALAALLHLQGVVAEEEDFVSLYLRCKPARRPDLYGATYQLDPLVIRNCVEVLITELLETNLEVGGIAIQPIGVVSEVVLVAQRRGPVHLINVVAEGDRARWDVYRPPARALRGHSCQNRDKLCDVSSITPFSTGFLTVDRHRVIEYSYTWEPEATESVVGQVGKFNHVAQDPVPDDLSWPSFVAMYQPYNWTHLDESFRIYPNVPHAMSRYLFVTDTGNHRVVMFNATVPGQMDYVFQFGETGVSHSGREGLNLPHGLAVWTPAIESSFEPVFANVFVADRQNNRLVKLNLGYELQYTSWGEAYRYMLVPQLYFSGEYGPGTEYNESLREPLGVQVFRHYIFVCESVGNAIVILALHPSNYNTFQFVTRMSPVSGVQMTGHISLSTVGYVWYTYVKLPMTYAIGCFFLEESLRESPEAHIMDEIAARCVNDTWYHLDVIANRTLYVEHVGYLLNATRTNWHFPEYPGYLDIEVFNLTFMFDLERLNTSVFDGRLRICAPPPPSTTPPMLSGNAEGWANGDGRVAQNAASHRGPGSAVLCLVVLCIFGAASADVATAAGGS